ncbi:Hypothetical predicted protein [Mytilus galloprovincialis]|uniref:Apple domain-containing protein n=2 Tax=Mytilus galloprovincialis TaxID=29158 RepID=A0A8B6BYI7_MYTGA|nr:Hypothetical predicted protein [Mytilus galloprovincialis]
MTIKCQLGSYINCNSIFNMAKVLIGWFIIYCFIGLFGTDGTLLDVHISKIVTGKVYFPMDQPVEEDKNYSLSQCILQCRSKSATCKMVIYDSSISDCGLISKFYDEKSLADCTEQVRSLRSDILAYQI